MKITRQQLDALGVPVFGHREAAEAGVNKSRTKRKRDGKGKPTLAQQAFIAACQAHGIVEVPVCEYLFAAEIGRKWRFDFAFAVASLAVEIDGGAWIRGRHNRGKGFIADMEKSNWAVRLGWAVLRFTPQQIKSGEAFSFIKATLEADV